MGFAYEGTIGGYIEIDAATGKVRDGGMFMIAELEEMCIRDRGIAYVHLSCEIRSEEFAPHILPDTASKTVDALLRAS